MRTLLILSISLISLFTKAQGVKTETILVKGNCEQCQERIENAADIKGVKNCKWNKTTKIATITYNSDVVSLQKIEEAIAAKGHDAADIAASESSYKKLPRCCQYKDAKCEESKK